MPRPIAFWWRLMHLISRQFRKRGKRNEPAFSCGRPRGKLAELRGESLETIAIKYSENFRTLSGLFPEQVHKRLFLDFRAHQHSRERKVGAPQVRARINETRVQRSRALDVLLIVVWNVAAV